MQDKNLWDNFFSSGKIDDYLKYKNCISNLKEEAAFEPYNDKRSYNQGTEGWRG